MKVLFVCSQARMRSFTARNLAVLGGLDAECCGSDSSSRFPINNQLLLDADLIICMEQKHRKVVGSMMGSEGKTVYSLGISDIYNPYDMDLVSELLSSLRAFHLYDIAQAVSIGQALYLSRKSHQASLN